MKRNIDIYLKTLEFNIVDIEKILKDLKISDVSISIYREILKQSSSILPNKWQSGRKYSRTLFVQNALGKSYPKKYSALSLSVDSMVNILDDLLDEQLKKEEKEGYVVEFLRIFSYFEKNANFKMNKIMSLYINKLITLAVAEKFYQKFIENKKDIKKIVELSANLLVCRGMDIDIFLEIGILDKKIEHLGKKKIGEIARLFRALNILKKDIADIKHDQKNGQKTVVTIVLSKNKTEFRFFIIDLVDYLINIQNEKIKYLVKSKNKNLLKIAKKFEAMTQLEKKNILELLINL